MFGRALTTRTITCCASLGSLLITYRGESRCSTQAPKSTDDILGLGAAAIDYIAEVEKFPSPDDKIRTISLKMEGGGNAGNTMTAVSRLGVHASIISKVGNDFHGRQVIKGLHEDGVNTNNIVVDNISTGFVFVIVDKATATRTCIATPVEKDLTSADIENAATKSDLFEGIKILHLDSRHTESALALVREANKRGVLVSIDVEKDRPPHLKHLLPLCNVVFTNQKFLSDYFHRGEGGQGDTDEMPGKELYTLESDDASVAEWADISDMASRLQNMVRLFRFDERAPYRPFEAVRGGHGGPQVVVSTLGAGGALLVLPKPPLLQPDAGFSLMHGQGQDAGDGKWCIDRSLLSRAPVRFATFSYRVQTMTRDGPRVREFEVVRCSSWPMGDGGDAVVDTTGAGDAFIGGFLVGLVGGMTSKECLVLGAAVAAEKLKSFGARAGLPSLQSLSRKLAEGAVVAPNTEERRA